MDDKTMPVTKASATLQILEETLLVKITDVSVGVDGFGNPKIMTMSRKVYEDMSKDLDMEIIEILKPEGVTMAQHKASLAEAVEVADTKKEKIENPFIAQQQNTAQQQKPVAAPKKPAAAKKPAQPKKPAVVEGPAKAPTDEEVKAAIEQAGMQDLVNKPPAA